MATINILLNGENHEVPAEIDLDQLLELFLLPKKRVAIEINNNVLRQSEWSKTNIKDSDKIEVVHFVGGG